MKFLYTNPVHALLTAAAITIVSIAAPGCGKPKDAPAAGTAAKARRGQAPAAEPAPTGSASPNAAPAEVFQVDRLDLRIESASPPIRGHALNAETVSIEPVVKVGAKVDPELRIQWNEAALGRAIRVVSFRRTTVHAGDGKEVAASAEAVNADIDQNGAWSIPLARLLAGHETELDAANVEKFAIRFKLDGGGEHEVTLLARFEGPLPVPQLSQEVASGYASAVAASEAFRRPVVPITRINVRNPSTRAMRLWVQVPEGSFYVRQSLVNHFFGPSATGIVGYAYEQWRTYQSVFYLSTKRVIFEGPKFQDTGEIGKWTRLELEPGKSISISIQGARDGTPVCGLPAKKMEMGIVPNSGNQSLPNEWSAAGTTLIGNPGVIYRLGVAGATLEATEPLEDPLPSLNWRVGDKLDEGTEHSCQGPI